MPARSGVLTGRGIATASLLAGIAVLATLAACSSTPALPLCSTGGAATEADGYRLGAGDRLQVTVFRHEGLSGEFAVDGTGTLALPLVGQIAADGLTARELDSTIERQLRDQAYLVDPHVSIEVLTYRPIYVLGEVARPGQYEYVAGMTLVTAVALAGGYTYRAGRDGVIISGGHCMRKADSATAVLPGEVVHVPERFF
jgi:polysaccharide export outer membrane protein